LPHSVKGSSDKQYADDDNNEWPQDIPYVGESGVDRYADEDYYDSEDYADNSASMGESEAFILPAAVFTRSEAFVL
jgi:hypothetical protein